MILHKIVAHKRRELAALIKRTPLSVLKKSVAVLPRRKKVFLKSLKTTGSIAVIAEIKRRSPSKGLLRKNFKPVQIARDYEAGGAAALSVLTDKKFFGGSPDVLRAVRKVTRIPLLRKDFTLDEYHVYEARLMGADAILLIAAILDVKTMKRLTVLASKLGLDALVEVHSQAELKKIAPLKSKLIGINNRDLRTFKVDIRTTQKLLKAVPRGTTIVSESGIQNHKDLLYLKGLGVSAVLVGEALMKEKDVRQALRRLRGVDL